MNPTLSEWQSFYVIIGSSAAALIGIQFVVFTLVGGMRRRPTEETVRAFGTPTVVHLTGALLVSAVMAAPWHSLLSPSMALVAGGGAGIVYSAVIFRRARRQTGYVPVWQDWLWYALWPFTVYAALATSAALLPTGAELAMDVVGAATLASLVIGIHNAWDAVTHVVLNEMRDVDDDHDPSAR